MLAPKAPRSLCACLRVCLRVCPGCVPNTRCTAFLRESVRACGVRECEHVPAQSACAWPSHRHVCVHVHIQVSVCVACVHTHATERVHVYDCMHGLGVRACVRARRASGARLAHKCACREQKTSHEPRACALKAGGLNESALVHEWGWVGAGAWVRLSWVRRCMGSLVQGCTSEQVTGGASD